MLKNLVIVESPAKAKTVQKFLGPDYRVEASFGHIRDLPKKNMGIDIEGGFIPSYEISPEKKRRITELKKMVKSTEKVWIATDDDREGEAIGWHLCKALGLDEHTTDRIVFHEITKSAIEQAIATPRKLYTNLINAQQSRRILDRIVGYEVSPVLWKKVKLGLSAGRVQSVAVKFLVEREREIRAFSAKESWKVTATLDHSLPLSVELVKIKNKKIVFHTQKEFEDFCLTHVIAGENISSKEVPSKEGNMQKKSTVMLSVQHTEAFTLFSTDKRASKRVPGAPFTTSTLQQEASRKLGYSVKTTMDVAQRLYQNGHITYMRTDSVNLSSLALAGAKKFIEEEFGEEYALTNGRKYKTKQANAQEAHEAIRPTAIEHTPKSISLEGMEKKLYTLIWERTVASQMKEAQIETTTYSFHSQQEDEWIAKGEVIVFPGFMKLYIEGKDEEEESKADMKMLPPLAKNTTLSSKEFLGQQKFSLPPPRYTEASLVKKLESEGIGRPSTYAPTIQTIQDRGYVMIEAKKLIPTDIAFVVNDYLEQTFARMMQYNFTAQVEGQFDAIARGDMEWKKMLEDFYTPFHQDVIEALGNEGRFAGERILGKDPVSGRTVLVRMSRGGPVVQIGAPSELAEEEKPRYANLGPGMSLDDISLEESLALFSFPKELGTYEGTIVILMQGRFGPYLKWGEISISLPKNIDLQALTLEDSAPYIEQKKRDNTPIGIYQEYPYTKGKGRFGPFLKWNNLYINIPRSIDPENITQEESEELIAKKIEKEKNRYIHRWNDEDIFVENGRYGPFIKFGKKNFSLQNAGKKITDTALLEKLTLEEVKNMILEQAPTAFKKSTKKSAETTKKPVKKTKNTPKKSIKKRGSNT